MTPIEFPGIILAAMSKPLPRALLVLLLAVVVPVQGYAAASIALCRALAHEEVPAGVVAAQHAHHSDGRTSGDHDLHSVPDGSSPHGAQHCAACGSCGVAAAISAFPAVYASDTPHRAVVIAPFAAPKGHVPEGLDRPPLSLLV